jgi:ceramide glucosyltransferase
MLDWFLSILPAISAAGAICGIAYALFTIWCASSFRSRKFKSSPAGAAPQVSILKPLCGVDPHAYESLRSHCRQDYPVFEIIFGVSDPNDGIVNIVQSVMREFPEIPMKLVECPEVLGTNLKISNLIQMLPHARYDILLVNDSDIGVPQDYLKRVVTPLTDTTVGLVTCLYRGVAADTVGSKLESLGISTDFIPGVLCAEYIERRIRFAMGSTLAFSLPALQAIGGFESIADYLADDYLLGYRISSAGKRIAISDCIVDHYLPRYSFGSFLQHQLRWARAIRSSRPGGYAGLIFTFAVPWSILTVALIPHRASAWVLFASALLLRYAVGVIVQRLVLEDPDSSRHLWLLPLRDLVAAAVWVWSYAGRTVVWRGRRFKLANGRLGH